MTLGFLRSWLNGGDLYPFEELILDEVKCHLAPDGRELLQRQLDTINKIQRLSVGKEVNLYHMHQGKAMFNDSLRFPYAADEALLATINLVRLSGGPKLKAEAWLAKGRLFSLVFNKPPKQFFEVSNLRRVTPEIVSVKIWVDPMRPDVSVDSKPIDISTLTEWFHGWCVKIQGVKLHSPLTESERLTFLDRIDAPLPRDYLEFISHSDGASFPSFKIYGIGSIRKVIWPEANYYVLAEIGGLGDLAVEEGSKESKIYLLHYENNNAVSLGTSLQEAVTNSLDHFMTSP
jgi:hypothetical protein